MVKRRPAADAVDFRRRLNIALAVCGLVAAVFIAKWRYDTRVKRVFRDLPRLAPAQEGRYRRLMLELGDYLLAHPPSPTHVDQRVVDIENESGQTLSQYHLDRPYIVTCELFAGHTAEIRTIRGNDTSTRHFLGFFLAYDRRNRTVKKFTWAQVRTGPERYDDDPTMGAQMYYYPGEPGYDEATPVAQAGGGR